VQQGAVQSTSILIARGDRMAGVRVAFTTSGGTGLTVSLYPDPAAGDAAAATVTADLAAPPGDYTVTTSVRAGFVSGPDVVEQARISVTVTPLDSNPPPAAFGRGLFDHAALALRDAAAVRDHGGRHRAQPAVLRVD
jgi:hypothetical protein